MFAGQASPLCLPSWSFPGCSWVFVISHAFSFSFNFNLFIWPCCMAHRILVPWLGSEPLPPTGETQSFNHWTTREDPTWISESVRFLSLSLCLSLTHTLLEFRWELNWMIAINYFSVPCSLMAATEALSNGSLLPNLMLSSHLAALSHSYWLWRVLLVS